MPVVAQIKVQKGWDEMGDSEFMKVFKEKKEEFQKHLEQGDFKIKGGRGRGARSSERLLDWFEKWLEGESPAGEQLRSAPAMPFDEFLDQVLGLVMDTLRGKEPALKHILEEQAAGGVSSWKRFSKSWKVLYIFEDAEVFYRIGKTTPRKGPNQGKELLVIELVLDGRKKQAFLPMLDHKEDLEKEIGLPLERELPRVEATGKYRFKLFLPYDHAYNGDTRAVAEKMAAMVLATRPHLNELGIL